MASIIITDGISEIFSRHIFSGASIPLLKGIIKMNRFLQFIYNHLSFIKKKWEANSHIGIFVQKKFEKPGADKGQRIFTAKPGLAEATYL